jgi:hypothetical protein
MPNPQAGEPHLVGCPRLLIQYTHSYPPYLMNSPHLQPAAGTPIDFKGPPNFLWKSVAGKVGCMYDRTPQAVWQKFQT